MGGRIAKGFWISTKSTAWSRLCAECGIRKVRLTGGEPLMCRNIADLVHRLAAVTGIEDLSLTTNGVLLGSMAADLKAAGLKRVNISLDAVDRQCYQQMTGFDSLPQVLEGMHKAIEIGLTPVRLNCVVMREHNLSQVVALARMTLHLPIAVRFIEYCPTSQNHGVSRRIRAECRGASDHRSAFGPLSERGCAGCRRTGRVLPDPGGGGDGRLHQWPILRVLCTTARG